MLYHCARTISIRRWQKHIKGKINAWILQGEKNYSEFTKTFYCIINYINLYNFIGYKYMQTAKKLRIIEKRRELRDVQVHSTLPNAAVLPQKRGIF